MKIQNTKTSLITFLIVIALLTIFAQLNRAEAPADPPGTYTTSWMGNNFMNFNGRQVVTELINDIAVSPNGVVFSAGYAEAWGGGASYNAIDGSFAGRYQGSNSGFGDPLSCVAADDNFVYYGCGPGILRAKHGGTDGGYTKFLAGGTEVSGLFIKNDKLYVSDNNNGKIHILKLSDMTEISSWDCPHPMHLTVDNNDNVWVVIYDQTSPGGALWWGEKIRSFSSTGVPGPEITTFEKPTTVGMDNTGLLLVGGLNEHSQIWKYDVSIGTPTVVDSFGTYKGIFGGKVPGAFTDSAKLHWIRSIKVDAYNNIYTSCGYGTFWGGSIEKWTPSGKLIWRDFAGTSLDCGGIDPYNETEVYSKYHHYSLDYSQTIPGTEWTLKGFTVDRFKYPNDIRVDHLTDVGSRSLGAGAFRIGGKLFVARSHQEGYECELFRKDSINDGEVLAPSVMMATGSDANNHFYNATTKTWIDKPKKDGLYVYGSWTIAKNGDLFTVCDQSKLVQYKNGGLDANGNPNWDASNALTIPIPEFDALCRMSYDSDSDIMYMAGDFPNNGIEYGSFLHVKKFENWGAGNRVSSFTKTLPFNDSQYTAETSWGGGMAVAFTTAGDYIFVLYGYGHVRILKKTDGGLVGTLKQNTNGWPGSGGQVDAHFGLSAFKRSNGQYILLFENAAWANIMMYRWCPDGTCTEVYKGVDSVKLDTDTLKIEGTGTGILTAGISPTNATNKNVTWTTSDANIATVSGKLTATVKGINPGTCYIKVVSQDSLKTANSVVVIVSPVAIDGVSLSPGTANLKLSGQVTLKATITPANATNKSLTWSSDNTLVASVDNNGKVTANSTGTATITVSASNGEKTAACTVTVTATGVNAKHFSGIKVFPNPFKDIVLTSEVVDNITIYNTDGVTLRSEEQTSQISTADLSGGIYFVKIEKDGNSFVKKCIKK